MGLDSVELLMEVEESFGIEIPDDVAQEITTVGELFEFIKSATELAPAGTCLSAATFYDLRDGLRSVGIDQRFGPSTHLHEIFPSKNRRSFWKTLAGHTKLRLPDLVRPSWVKFVGSGSVLLGAYLIASSVSQQEFPGSSFLLVFILCLILLGVVACIVTSPLATNFADDFDTFRTLSERVLALNATKQKNRHGPMGPNDIWVVLRGLIQHQVGAESEEVTPDANFVKDLGFD